MLENVHVTVFMFLGRMYYYKNQYYPTIIIATMIYITLIHKGPM